MTTFSPIGHFLTTPATIVNRSQTGAGDRYGTPGWVEAAPVETLVFWHPVTTEEQVQRPAGVVTVRAYARGDVTISTLARITIAGRRFEVAAPPAQWVHPHSGDTYQTVELVEHSPEEAGS